MADPLRRRSALAAAYREGGAGALSVRERRPLEMVQFSAWEDRTEHAGIALPPPGRTGEGEVTALWIGPRRWLLVAREGTGLLQRAGAEAGVFVDQSEGRTVLRLSGASAPEVLAKGTGIDLATSAFGAGSCAATLLAHVGVVLHAANADTFDLSVPRSYGLHVWEWLHEAASVDGLRVERAESG